MRGVRVEIGTFNRIAMFVLLGWAFSPSGMAQGQVSPANDATNVPTTVEVTWPATQNATSYYLYLGTTPGTSNVLNTGELPAPAYVADGLPASTQLHATFWARIDGRWISTGSSSFRTGDTASPSAIAELQTPGSQDEAIPQALTFTWNAVPGATAYYLYVGNTAGAMDVGHSGETTNTSFLVNNMPLDQQVHVRLWTKLSGVWRYRDYQYLVLGNATALTRPVVAGKIDPATSYEWRPLYGAERFYLYVGTAPGRKDVIDSGETLRTSWPMTPLAGGTTYYIRLHTKKSTVWYWRDYTIQTDDISLLTKPWNDQQLVDPASSYAWMPVADAEKYYLYVGSTPGAKDLVNTGETTQLKYPTRALPGGVPLYARMWVRKAGGWRYRDSVFSTRASPRFIFPTPGQVGVGSSIRFKWAPVAGAASYTLSVGTTPGDDDVFAATETANSELDVTSLPASAALYATVTTKVGGNDVAGQVVFTTNASSAAARLLVPVDGGTLPAGTSIKWRPAALGRAYRLEIGTATGTADLLDTGEIKVNERFVEQLPVGVPLHARLTTYFLKGSVHTRSFTFTKQANGFPLESRLAEAERATEFIRLQGFGNLPLPNGMLADSVREAGKDIANCVDYAGSLVRAIAELDLQVTARTGAGCLVPNTYDCHTYTEVFDDATQEWFVLDATFGMMPRRAGDLGRATAADISAATREQRWDAIEYTALTPMGFAIAETYYIDYPLMFYQLYQPNLFTLQAAEESVLHLYERVPAPLNSGGAISVAIRCAPGQSSARVQIGGAEQQVTCSGIDNLSEIFRASSVVPIGDESEEVGIYRPLRFTFGPD